MDQTNLNVVDAFVVPPAEAALPPGGLSFRDARWKTWTLWLGFAVLVAWRGTSFFGPWLAQLPWWVLLVVAGLVPETFLLVFPLLTRQPRGAGVFRRASFSRVLLELALAIPLVIATMMSLAVINLAIGWLMPGETLTPDAVRNLAASPRPALTYFMLVLSFTLGPVAEEVFFRGFLHNALRARMPGFIAGAIQCVAFGVVHVYEPIATGVVIFLGVVLTLVYQWRKTLLAPIFVHAGVNLCASAGVLILMSANANAPVLGITSDPADQACVIRSIAPGSPADLAHLKVGDTITAIDDEPVPQFPQLVQIVRRHAAGDTVKIAVQREGAPLEFDVRLVSRRSLEAP